MQLRVHGHDSRAEIEAAYCYAEACGYGVLTDHAPWIHREGVLWHEPSQCDLLFVTLKTSELLFSPTTRYRDLARRPGNSDGGHPLADQRHPCSCRLLLSENGLAAFPGRSTRQEF